MLKYPPIEKIYEALGAISANRVHLEDSAAKVDSSDFNKGNL